MTEATNNYPGTLTGTNVGLTRSDIDLDHKETRIDGEDPLGLLYDHYTVNNHHENIYCPQDKPYEIWE